MLDCFLREQLHGEHPCLADLSLCWPGAERLEGPRLEKQEQGSAQALRGAGLLILLAGVS